MKLNARWLILYGLGLPQGSVLARLSFVHYIQLYSICSWLTRCTHCLGPPNTATTPKPLPVSKPTVSALILIKHNSSGSVYRVRARLGYSQDWHGSFSRYRFHADVSLGPRCGCYMSLFVVICRYMSLNAYCVYDCNDWLFVVASNKQHLIEKLNWIENVVIWLSLFIVICRYMSLYYVVKCRYMLIYVVICCYMLFYAPGTYRILVTSLAWRAQEPSSVIATRVK